MADAYMNLYLICHNFSTAVSLSLFSVQCTSAFLGQFFRLVGMCYQRTCDELLQTTKYELSEIILHVKSYLCISIPRLLIFVPFLLL